jgi:hypothetical protein
LTRRGCWRLRRACRTLLICRAPQAIGVLLDAAASAACRGRAEQRTTIRRRSGPARCCTANLR